MSCIFSENCFQDYIYSNFFSNAMDDCREDAPIYAKLGKEGKIEIEKDKNRIIRKIASFFSLKPNSDLLAVNQKLTSIYEQAIANKGAEFERLKSEIREINDEKFSNLSKNLFILESAFKKGNHQNMIQDKLRKIINCFRRIFHFSLLSPIHYKELDTLSFLLALKGKQNDISLDISAPPILPELIIENFEKLKKDKYQPIQFKYGSGNIGIFYNKIQQCYSMNVQTPGFTSSYYISDTPIKLKDQKLGIFQFTIQTGDPQLERKKEIFIDMQSDGLN
jgi:hypothetical protein